MPAAEYAALPLKRRLASPVTWRPLLVGVKDFKPIASFRRLLGPHHPLVRRA